MILYIHYIYCACSASTGRIYPHSALLALLIPITNSTFGCFMATLILITSSNIVVGASRLQELLDLNAIAQQAAPPLSPLPSPSPPLFAAYLLLGVFTNSFNRLLQSPLSLCALLKLVINVVCS